MNHPVAVIGAGPFGLSTAAHLRARGIPVRVFGEPMVSWRDHMPAGMLLKSTPAASSIDAPQSGHTLADYCDAVGVPRLVADEDIIPVETFIAYGEWFQQRLVPELEQVRVVSVDRRHRSTGSHGTSRHGSGDGFELKLDSGELFTARAVVVATGLSGLAHLPPELAGAAPDGPSPTGPVSHSSQHHDLSRFAGGELIVVGAGQSALETAALAAEAGAKVRVVSRGSGRVAFGAPLAAAQAAARVAVRQRVVALGPLLLPAALPLPPGPGPPLPGPPGSRTARGVVAARPVRGEGGGE